jgi:N6-L-threonylcarbamoyladenine synthase
MKILAIDTSCDETASAVTDGRKVLSNVIYSQILIHKKWGGVVPSLAKRAHEERIDYVIEETIKKLRITNYELKNYINFVAVTYGPGLAVALEVGIKKAKELAKKYHKKLIAVNHMEGHIYSCFVQNSKGNPKNDFNFPYLALLVSGGHTELVVFKNHINYEVIGQTIDDAAGEALDKIAKLLGLGYPGGPVIERLASEVDNRDYYHFPRPMIRSNYLNFSFSGLKTAFYYFLRSRSNAIPSMSWRSASWRRSNLNIRELASSFQEAVFETLLIKTEKAIKQTEINNLVVGGGVIANLYLRKKLRQLVKKYKGTVLFPPYKYLTGDNAAMIGVAAYYKAQRNQFVKNIEEFDRVPRLSLRLLRHPTGDLASI